MTPEAIAAYAGGAVTVLVGYGKFIYWLSSKKTEKKIYRDNGLERRENTITRTEHEECRKNREGKEDILFSDLTRIEGCVRQNRTELREDIRSLGDKAEIARGKIFDKLDELTKRSYLQGGRGDNTNV